MKHKSLLSTTLSVLLATLLLQQPVHAQADDARPAKTLTGRMVTEQMYAPALEGALLNPSTNRTVSVYLPPDYDTRPDDRFPVVYFLHAWFDTRSAFITAIGGQSALDAFFNQNGAKQMIVVFPDTYYQYQGCFFTNSHVAGNWQDFITDDLVSYIDSTYRTIPEAESRGVTGLATGAYGAIKLGMLRPDVFQAVYGLAPVELAFLCKERGGPS
jgi:S-formylglutathione hydrolase